MDQTITINTHAYGLRRQMPTLNERSTSVAGVVYVATAGHQDQKKGGVDIVRTVRKITIPITLTDNGVTRIVEGSASLIYEVPKGATLAQITPAHTELVSWQGQESFLSDVFSQQI